MCRYSSYSNMPKTIRPWQTVFCNFLYARKAIFKKSRGTKSMVSRQCLLLKITMTNQGCQSMSQNRIEVPCGWHKAQLNTRANLVLQIDAVDRSVIIKNKSRTNRGKFVRINRQPREHSTTELVTSGLIPNVLVLYISKCPANT